MSNFAAQFLILVLFSFNTYAGPFDRNRPDIRPGQRGTIAQEAMGSNHNQYSLLNPGSNQSVFVRNNILLQQQYGSNANANGYMTFNPQSSLSGNGSIASIDAMSKHLLESNGGNATTNRVASDPFALKLAKSQTQGMVFINSASTNPSVSSESMSLDAGSYIVLIIDTANKNTIAINYPGQTFGFVPSATTIANPGAK